MYEIELLNKADVYRMFLFYYVIFGMGFMLGYWRTTKRTNTGEKILATMIVSLTWLYWVGIEVGDRFAISDDKQNAILEEKRREKDRQDIKLIKR